MLNYNSISEKLMLSTIKINTNNGSGTGFFFRFKIEDNFIPILVTNKHVINYNKNEKVELSFHISENNNVSSKNLNIELERNWIFHEKYDLCFTFIADVLNGIKSKFRKEVAICYLEEELILKNLDELQALEEIIMIGYPIGLWDKINNLPILRKGITASHPALSFNEEGIGLVDIACFPGSSGSPIFILNEGSYKIKDGIAIGDRIIFLGILFAGPIYNAIGKIEVKEIEMKAVPVPSVGLMINLGYYIQAQVILNFKDTITKILEEQLVEEKI